MSKNSLINNSQGIFIESQYIIKKFANTQVLNNLNLTIYPGEFVCVVGRSGCGKSTFLRLLAGLEKASFGEITLDGEKTTVDYNNGLLTINIPRKVVKEEPKAKKLF